MAIGIVIFLGIIQGAFMFIPVSSTAHLVLAQHWLIGQGVDLPAPDSAEMILFDLVVHVGTVVSIVVVFHRSLWRLARDAVAGLGTMLSRPSPIPLAVRLVLLLVLSVFATGVIGITFKLFFEAAFAHPQMVAAMLIMTGVLLWISDKLPPRPRGLRGIKPSTALIIGAAQGLALIPGISRSGITIVASLFTGLKRRWAAEYSFFLAIPTILAATAVQSVEVIGSDEPLRLGWLEMGVGFGVAAVVGTAALWLVVKLLRRAQLRIFSWYLWLLAGLVLFGLIPLGH